MKMPMGGYMKPVVEEEEVVEIVVAPLTPTTWNPGIISMLGTTSGSVPKWYLSCRTFV